MKQKIVLADPHPVIHQGILRAIEPDSELEIVATTTELIRVPDLIQNFKPNLVITEVRFNDNDALKALEPILLQRETMAVIVFSHYGDSINIARAGALGCYEYIVKTSDLSILIDTARKAVKGIPADPEGALLSTKTRIMANRGNTDSANPLTQREMQVIRHVAMGLKNREIGLSLKISVETVKEHVQNILRKLSVNDRTQAAVTAVRREWI